MYAVYLIKQFPHNEKLVLKLFDTYKEAFAWESCQKVDPENEDTLIEKIL